MRGVNKVILVGTLGRDPETRYTADGKAITNLNVATSEKWKDQTGQPQEKTEWHRVVIFGKLAEIAQQFLTKGSQVYLEGKLQTRKWQDQASGQDRYATEVVLDFNGVMQMLGGGNGGNQQQQAPQQQRTQQQYQQPQQRPNQNQTAMQAQRPTYQPNDFGDDVPFN